MYIELKGKDKESFLSKHEQRKYKNVGHQFALMKGVGKQVCKSCGLIALRNRAADWCIDKGCWYDVHPQYKSAMRKMAGGKR